MNREQADALSRVLIEWYPSAYGTPGDEGVPREIVEHRARISAALLAAFPEDAPAVAKEARVVPEWAEALALSFPLSTNQSARLTSLLVETRRKALEEAAGIDGLIVRMGDELGAIRTYQRAILALRDKEPS